MRIHKSNKHRKCLDRNESLNEVKYNIETWERKMKKGGSVRAEEGKRYKSDLGGQETLSLAKRQKKIITRKDRNPIRIIGYSWSGPAVHTHTQIIYRIRKGLQQIRNHERKSIGEENPDILGSFLGDLFFASFSKITFQIMSKPKLIQKNRIRLADTAISLVHFSPNAYLISRKTITKLTVLISNS